MTKKSSIQPDVQDPLVSAQELPKRWADLTSGPDGDLLGSVPSKNILDDIEALKRLKEPQQKSQAQRRTALFIAAIFLATLLGIFGVYTTQHIPLKRYLRQHRVKQNIQPQTAVLQKRPLASFSDFSDRLPSLTEPQIAHMRRVLKYIYHNVDPRTFLAYSHPGDQRLLHWSVIYDDAMRSLLHMNTGDIGMARKTIDYFIENKAIQKNGWVMKNGQKVLREGWIVNIVDAAEGRPGGRGVEHIAHVGPNIYVGIAAIHLYKATGDRLYLE